MARKIRLAGLFGLFVCGCVLVAQGAGVAGPIGSGVVADEFLDNFGNRQYAMTCLKLQSGPMGPVWVTLGGVYYKNTNYTVSLASAQPAVFYKYSQAMSGLASGVVYRFTIDRNVGGTTGFTLVNDYQFAAP